MSWRPRYKVPGLPALGAGLLAAGLAVQAALPWETPLPPAPAATRARLPAAPPPVQPLGDGINIRARALFAPGRAYLPGGAAAAAAGSAAAAPDPAREITLIGSARAGRVGVGVFRDGSGQIVTRRVGGRVSGWRLAALSRDRAVLARGGERMTLRLGAGGASAPQAFGNVIAPAGDAGEEER